MAVRMPEDNSRVPVPSRLGSLDVTIQSMRRRHLRSVIRIENQVYPRPWSVGLFMSEKSLRSSRNYYIAKCHGEVVGYAGMMVAAGETHITNIAVAPSWTRNHIATRLMIQLMRASLAHQAHDVTLEVRAGNVSAQAMYYRFGFAPAGVRKNYYPETNEDALIMWVRGIGSTEYANRIEAVAQRIGGSTSWASP